MKDKNLVIAFLGSPDGYYKPFDGRDLSIDMTVKDFFENYGYKYRKDLNLGRYRAEGIHGFFINCGEIVGILVDSVRLVGRIS